jgi:hypothetical protein
MDKSLTSKYKRLKFDANFDSNDFFNGAEEKEFIQLIMLQGMRNVTEVFLVVVQ